MIIKDEKGMSISSNEIIISDNHFSPEMIAGLIWGKNNIWQSQLLIELAKIKAENHNAFEMQTLFIADSFKNEFDEKFNQEDIAILQAELTNFLETFNIFMREPVNRSKPL